jgi:RNA polymerase sigma-70 factor, ECF subfamily
MTTLDPDGVAHVFRQEYGRAVAVLIRSLGDIDLAEEAVQEAFAAALQRWPTTGLPPSPAGWIITTARHRAVDRLRRESSREQRHAQAALLHTADPTPEEGAVEDERLRLVFTCCHPALAVPAQVALTLRLLGGLSTPEIARAFLVPEATMAQRLVRAKRKIRDAGIPYRVPHEADLPARLRGVLAVVYLVYTEGHSATSGTRLVRVDLCEEAVRLARLLAELMPDEPEALGLLALLLLSESRRPARTALGESGDRLIPLAEQDRSRWDRSLVAEGQALVRRCLRRGQPGPYQLQAAIAAVHADATTPAATDWAQVLALYDQLLAISPTPVVALNRAVALAEVEGPAAALHVVEGLQLPGYAPLPAVRADLLRRTGQHARARSAYDEAIAACGNEAQRAFLTLRRAQLED